MALDAALYPWLTEPWQRLQGYRYAQRIPQALLIVGRQGVGKRQLAEAFAALLLCQQTGLANSEHTISAACGICPSCHLLAAETHPDYLLAQPAEPGKGIAIDTVRQLIDKLSLKPQYSGYRVVLIDSAHALNTAAANALLKVLEEPPQYTVMLLISAMPSRIPATLVSRCQWLSVAPPPRKMALAWLLAQDSGLAADAALAAASNAPLKALDLARSGLLEQRQYLFNLWLGLVQNRLEPIQAAEKLVNVPLDALIDWLYSWAGDVFKLTQLAKLECLVNADHLAQLQTAARFLESAQINGFVDTLQRCKRQLTINPQLNRQLLIEEILIAWQRLTKPGAIT